MTRQKMLRCCVAIAALPLLGANKPPREIHISQRPAAEVVACLSDQIATFDTPNVSPGAGGRTRITTKIMHVTRIDLTVTAAPTTVEVRGKGSKKLRQIIGGCL